MIGDRIDDQPDDGLYSTAVGYLQAVQPFFVGDGTCVDADEAAGQHRFQLIEPQLQTVMFAFPVNGIDLTD